MRIAQIQSAAMAIPGEPARHGQLPGLIAGGLVRALLISSTLMAAVVFAGASGPALLGFKTMLVTSGSMEPTIHTGDAVVLRPTPSESIASSFRDGFVRIGDVVTFTPYGAAGMVTHRVIAVKALQGETYFQTKGDANKTPDANLANAGAVYGKVAFRLPKFGYLVHFAATPLGKTVLIILPMIVLMSKEVRNMLGARKTRDPQATRRKTVVEAKLNDVPAT
ncbi:MAG: signal peptidase I [Chloroflexota bacterium]